MPGSSSPHEKRLLELETAQRAMFNILDDLNTERGRFEATQRATFNILDDLNAQKDRLEVTQKAMLNLLDDFDQERVKVALSLAEKDVLLREIHHRVKNNLQVIASLLSLAAGNVKDERARAAFDDSKNRVTSMALVHETLYRSNDLGRVDFADYVRRLSAELFRSFGARSEKVRLTLDVVSGVLPVDIAVPCGLILSELLTNCLKHAFPRGRRGQVTIGFVPEGGTWRLSVTDDGVGLPVGFDLDKSQTLGLRLMRNLAGQVGGTLELDARSGTRFSIAFPSPEKRAQAVSGSLAA